MPSEHAEELDGSVRLVEDQMWPECAIANGDYLEASLAALGYPEEYISEAVEIRDAGQRAEQAIGLNPRDRNFGPDGAIDAMMERHRAVRQGTLGRLLDWYSGRDYEIIRSERVRTDVSLFILSAPPVEGCKAGYSRALSEGRAMSWSFTVAGNGPKGKSTYNVEVETEFSATAGQSKIVFAPVMVDVQEVKIIENGKLIGVGTRREPVENAHMRPGAKLLKTLADVALEVDGELYPLKDDAPGAESTYSHKVEQQRGLSLEIGFKALGMDHTLTGEASLKEAATFKCALMGGHDYTLFRTRGVTGVGWRVE